ncbi:MAG: hypothetical protein IT427_12805 [Pirellulales bacterium]|nr:hypothetical protein [Pirellulales bacterium]
MDSTPAATDPTVGTWDSTATEPEAINLTRTGAIDGGPTAAYSGNNYLELSRAGEAAPRDRPFMGALFSNPVDLATASLHAEFQMYFKATPYNFVYTVLQKSLVATGSVSPQTNLLVPIGFGDNTGAPGDHTTMWYWNGSSDWVDTGLDLTNDAWNEVTLDWNHATGKFTVGINGIPWEAPVVWGTADSIGALEIATGWELGKLFIDATGPLAPPNHPGDFDGNGTVDGADFVAWQTNFPKESDATLAQGDADGNGTVDGADFVVWQTNFPFASSSSIVPVPEPAGIALAGIAVVGSLGLVFRRNRGLA